MSSSARVAPQAASSRLTAIGLCAVGLLATATVVAVGPSAPSNRVGVSNTAYKHGRRSSLEAHGLQEGKQEEQEDEGKQEEDSDYDGDSNRQVNRLGDRDRPGDRYQIWQRQENQKTRQQYNHEVWPLQEGPELEKVKEAFIQKLLHPLEDYAMKGDIWPLKATDEQWTEFSTQLREKLPDLYDMAQVERNKQLARAAA